MEYVGQIHLGQGGRHCYSTLSHILMYPIPLRLDQRRWCRNSFINYSNKNQEVENKNLLCIWRKYSASRVSCLHSDDRHKAFTRRQDEERTKNEDTEHLLTVKYIHWIQTRALPRRQDDDSHEDIERRVAAIDFPSFLPRGSFQIKTTDTTPTREIHIQFHLGPSRGTLPTLYHEGSKRFTNCTASLLNLDLYPHEISIWPIRNSTRTRQREM